LSTPGGKPASFELAGLERRKRSLLGQLDDHSVSAGDSGANLPGEHEKRNVPRDDGSTDANGLVACERELLRSLDNLAMNLVAPARIIADTLNNLNDVKAF